MPRLLFFALLFIFTLYFLYQFFFVSIFFVSIFSHFFNHCGWYRLFSENLIEFKIPKRVIFSHEKSTPVFSTFEIFIYAEEFQQTWGLRLGGGLAESRCPIRRALSWADKHHSEFPPHRHHTFSQIFREKSGKMRIKFILLFQT